MTQPLWNELAARANLTLTDDQHAKLRRYLELLFAANQTMNLTRIADLASAEVQHVGDALTALPYLPAEPHRLADVGTGGGVPGIPLAIARPDVRVLLVEATGKKAAFLRTAVAELGLTNVEVDQRRAEEVGQDEHLRERFDVAIARAVATMAWLAEWLLPLVHKRGRALAMKGPKVIEELPLAARAIKLLGGGEPSIHPVQLPGTEHRVIVQIPKITKTSLRYPRAATRAKGNPL
jgi:16S rRNA (guanine527-N7)-methyltransferase